MQTLLHDTQASSIISSMSRHLNNLFSFTAIGFTSNQNQNTHALPPDSHVCINGQSYHHMLHMDEGSHSIRWFLYDEMEQDLQGREWEVDSAWVDAICNSLEQCNPYLQHLQSFASIQNTQYSALELSAPSSGGDFTAIAHIANSTAFHP